MGERVGEASSEEKKWKWREAVCEAEFEDADPDRRRRKYKSDGTFVPQVQMDHYDLSNTILKMAKKRAQVDATLTVCACSDIFSQDLEDLPDDVKGQTRASTRQPARAATTRPTTSTEGLAPKFGRDAEKPLSEVSDESLMWYADVLAENVADPKKSRFKDANQKVLNQINAELDKRAQAIDEAEDEAHGPIPEHNPVSAKGKKAMSAADPLEPQ